MYLFVVILFVVIFQFTVAQIIYFIFIMGFFEIFVFSE